MRRTFNSRGDDDDSKDYNDDDDNDDDEEDDSGKITSHQPPLNLWRESLKARLGSFAQLKLKHD